MVDGCGNMIGDENSRANNIMKGGGVHRSDLFEVRGLVVPRVFFRGRGTLFHGLQYLKVDYRIHGQKYAKKSITKAGNKINRQGYGNDHGEGVTHLPAILLEEILQQVTSNLSSVQRKNREEV